MNNYFLYILISSNIIFFILGYLVCKVTNFHGVSYNSQGISRTQLKKDNLKNVVIDDSKYITSINTSDLEKKYTNIATEIKSDESISQSVSKLKQMKG